MRSTHHDMAAIQADVIEHDVDPRRTPCGQANEPEKRGNDGEVFQTSRNAKPLTVERVRGLLCKVPGGALLSHGEAPHYHRRRCVSRPSSGWDRVVPHRHSRQAVNGNTWSVKSVRAQVTSAALSRDFRAIRLFSERLGVIWSSRTVN